MIREREPFIFHTLGFFSARSYDLNSGVISPYADSVTNETECSNVVLTVVRGRSGDARGRVAVVCHIAITNRNWHSAADISY